MSDTADLIWAILLILLFPIAWGTSSFALCFILARKYTFKIAFPLVTITGAALFYIFRILEVLGWSLLNMYEGSFAYNLSRNYNDFFGWIDTDASIDYVLYRRLEIPIPNWSHLNIFFDVSALELFYFLFIGAVIFSAAIAWKRGIMWKLVALALLTVTLAFHLYVMAHWMYLSGHI